MSTRSIYLLGAPGSGKSTLMAELIRAEALIPADPVKLRGLLVGHRLVDPRGVVSGLYLGRSRKRFPGTDALGMAVHPDAVAWANSAELPGLVLGEGARLGTFVFLTALASRSRLTVGHLAASEELLDERCAARGSTQNPAWRRGARTRAARAAQALVEIGVDVVELDASRPVDELAADLIP